jgi:Domain of unknown function (DU1801)
VVPCAAALTRERGRRQRAPRLLGDRRPRRTRSSQRSKVRPVVSSWLDEAGQIGLTARLGTPDKDEMPNQTQEVDEFLDNLSHPLREGVIATRAAILASDEQITEHIKWNAPSFCYRGDDRVTFRLHPADRFQIVFHRGAKVREDSGDFVFEDDSGLLRWVADDRATVTFEDMAEIEAKQAALVEIVGRWMRSTVDT